MMSRILVWTGAAAVVLAVAAAMIEPGFTPPKQKILFLAAQYGILLPALVVAVLLGRRQTPEARKIAAPRFWTIAVAYLLVLVPVAAFLHPGVIGADESVYLFEAKCLRSGSLYTQAPPVSEPEMHFTHNLVVGHKWFGKYPFAWPALLSLASVAGLQWLVNPLLGLLLLWLSYGIGEFLFLPGQAAWGVLLMAASPFFTLNCLGYMSHVACGVAVAGAAWCYLRSVKARTALSIAAAGGCVAAAMLVRPFTGMCVGVALGAATLFEFRSNRRVLAVGAGAALVLMGATVLIHGVVNQSLTGSFTRSPYAAYHHQAVIPTEVSLSPRVVAHTLAVFTPIRLSKTVSAAFPFVFLPAFFALWRWRRRRDVWVIALLFAVLVLGHVVQQEDSGSWIGERYYFEGFFAVSLLAGAGWSELAGGYSARLRRTVLASAAVACAAVWFFFLHQQFELCWPYREIALAAQSPPVFSGVVFLITAPHFEAPLYNLNRPGGKLLFLPDRGDGRERQIAAKLGQHRWALLTYDAASRRARWRLEVE
jgi:hypothetical protein